MKHPLSIRSWGVVSPGGTNVASLETTEQWPLTAVSDASSPTLQHPVHLIDPKSTHFDQWKLRPRLRRASPISLYMIEAVNQALAGAPEIDRSRVGIVSTSFLGCLVYSIRFYRQFQKEGRRFASPALFPETVANSPLSHLVSELGLGGPAYSLLGDKSSWASALKTAACWLLNGDADHVVVLGCEEFEQHELDAFRSAGWLGKAYSAPFAEGAGAILLSKQSDPEAPVLSAIADGYTFLNRSECRTAATQCLDGFPPETPILRNAVGWLQPIANALLEKRPKCDTIPQRSCEGFTAAAAWDTIQAAAYLAKNPSKDLLVPFWGLSQQFSAALLNGPAKLA